MQWASAISDAKDIRQAIAITTEQVSKSLSNQAPDLALIFVSAHHESHYDHIPLLIREFTQSGLLIGCSAGGVIGGGQEIEDRPGFSLTAAILPDVDLMPLRMETNLIPESEAPQQDWEQVLHVKAAQDPHFILLPDPFSFEAEKFLPGIDAAFPISQKVGGLASGGGQLGANALFLGRKCHRSGMVGVALSGNVAVDTLVAQGCRPIGMPMFITRCEGNVLYELDGRSPLDVLRELYTELSEPDQSLFSESLFMGIVMQESLQKYRQGDFLIRNIVGLDAETEALIIGAHLKENTVVQLHLRDAETSTADLDELLCRYATKPSKADAKGSLLFSCMGRGTNLYGSPNHDSNLLKKYLGELPVGGFFCNGEIGPVHGTTFLHGYTSSLGVFRARES